MTFSSLISYTIPHHDKYNRRPVKVTRVIQHHWADVTMGGENSLASPRRRASVNYLVHNDGIIVGQVPEEFRPWTSSSAAADNPSITIECQNETASPEWRVSSAALNSLARLLADIGKRHGFGALNRVNYRGHREFASTACPGPYLYPRLQLVCDIANGIHKPDPTPTPVVIIKEYDDMQGLVESCFRSYVGREARTPETDYWLVTAAESNWGGSTLRTKILGSAPEVGTVFKAYSDFLGRAPSTADVISWTTPGRTIGEVRNDIYNSLEAKKYRG